MGVVPLLRPVTMPVPLTAALVLPALQVPPGIALDSVTDVPVHTLSGPVMVPALGNGFTVIVVLVLMLPQLVVTV